MRLYQLALGLVIIFSALALPGLAIGCQGGTCDCGESLEGNAGEEYYLTINDDITQSTCPAAGLKINSENITLDCNGFAIRGSYSLISGAYGIEFTRYAIRSEARNCIVTDFTNLIVSYNGYNKIRNNVLYNSGTYTGTGIWAGNALGTEIFDNEVYNVEYGMWVDHSSHNTKIYNNNVHDTGSTGIRVLSSNGVYVHHNTITRASLSNPDSGFNAYGSPYMTIEFNNIQNSPKGASFRDDNPGTIFRFNSLSNNNVGLYFYWDAQNVRADSNQICGNSQYDIESTANGANSGSHNRCATTSGWSDSTATSGCTYSCSDFGNTRKLEINSQYKCRNGKGKGCEYTAMGEPYIVGRLGNTETEPNPEIQRSPRAQKINSKQNKLNGLRSAEISPNTEIQKSSSTQKESSK